MTTQHTIFVCQSCASVWKDGLRFGTSGGEQLLKELTAQYQNWSGAANFTIKAVECMSACNRSCVIAFSAPNKFTYVFGDLSRDVQMLSATSTAVLECANLYFQKPDGMMLWSERPELLKKGIVARIPSSF